MNTTLPLPNKKITQIVIKKEDQIEATAELCVHVENVIGLDEKIEEKDSNAWGEF